MNSSELARILSLQETTDLDFKAKLDEISLPDLPKDIAAFSNAEGGRVIVGVTDNPREIVGVEWNEKLTEQVMQAGRNCKPPVEVRIEERKHKSKNLAIIEIPKGSMIVADDKNRFPQRVGDETFFLDFRMALYLAGTRGLVPNSAAPYSGFPSTPSPPPRRRKKVGEIELFLYSRLEKLDPNIRASALIDLHNFAFRSEIEKIPGFYEKLVELLAENDQTVKLCVLNLIERIEPVTSQKTRVKHKSMLSDALKRYCLHDSTLRGRALYLLAIIGPTESTSLYVKTVMEEPQSNIPPSREPKQHATCFR